MTFHVGTAASVRAKHRMPVEGPEGDLHAHDYRLDVMVERDALDERGMVCNLDVLNAALGKIVKQLDDQDLERIKPPDVEAVTVEVFATWIHGQLVDVVRREGAEKLTVRVWESDVAFGGYSSPLA
jgi:6-pyruvoyltetrahydropterin/6-carboxytetrahydropterin synthase